jgi:hypothetical protein
MAIVSLLHLPEDSPAREAFVFEHLMAHRALGRVSVSLLLDPMQNEEVPASKWHLDHQTAHNQVRGAINSDQILRDSNLLDEEARIWWTFINHQEHMLLTAAQSR